jgi:fructose-bisphosphate aldolase class I
MSNELEATAHALLAPGKGLLAADESLPTIEGRFKNLGIASTPETRRAYRELLFTTPGCGEFLSGVILFDETLRASDSNGTPFPQLLAGQSIVPGIKVDAGAKDFALHPGEKITEGLDGLRERLNQYREMGARFAKWRAVISIGDGLPSSACLDFNAHALARYAGLCQEAGLVPIVEPEVVMDGDHSIERCEAVTQETLRATFAALVEGRVLLEGMLLKPNMILPGKDATGKASVEEVAERTLRVLRRAVPAAVPGIVFLSGGQNDREATARLGAMNSNGDWPWQLTFSFARALQDEPMKIWKGDGQNVAAAQRAFEHRLRLNSAASRGQYDASMEEDAR